MIENAMKKPPRMARRAGAPPAHPYLPAIIRPTVVRLRDVERRCRTDAAFARLLVERPDFRGTLARALLARDEHARARFADVAALADYLSALHAG